MGWPITFLNIYRDKKKEDEKLKALLSLKHAIECEFYERCQSIIGIAKEFGAKQREIDRVLELSLKTRGGRMAECVDVK